MLRCTLSTPLLFTLLFTGCFGTPDAESLFASSDRRGVAGSPDETFDPSVGMETPLLEVAGSAGTPHPGAGAMAGAAGSQGTGSQGTGGSGQAGASGVAGLGAGPGADDAGADGAVGCAEAFRTCPHTFALQDFAGVAHDVQLWGVFPPNVWASGITMQKSGASWFVAADVPWGFDVHYKYLVDGVWLVDPSLESPAVPDIQGGGMSSVLPGDSCAMWDCGAIEVPDCPESERAAQVRMVIEDAGYQAVGIAGSFNDWLPSAMSRVGSQWAVNVPELPWGSHIEYKFVVDGQWIRDPSNTITNPDGFGGENSVLRVEGDWWSCHG